MGKYNMVIHAATHQVLRSEALRDVDDAIAVPVLNVIEKYLLNLCNEIEETTLRGDSDRIINLRMEAEISNFSKVLYQVFPKV